MITRHDASIDQLARFEGGPCVSVVFPVDLRHPDERRDVLLAHELLGAAQRRLTAEGFADADALVDVDVAACRRQAVLGHATGVAVYRAPGFRIDVLLWAPVAPLVAVGDRFALVPLVLAGDRRWTGHLLTVGAAHTALFRVADGALERVVVAGLPGDVDEALWYERHERHAGAHGGGSDGRGGTTVHHGAGGAEDDRKARLQRYLRKVDDLVVDVVGRTDPLLVVGTAGNVALFQRTTHHPWTVGLPLGSPGELTATELLAGAAEVADASRVAVVDRAVDRYASLAGTGLATADRQELAAAAALGRIDTLLVGPSLAGPAGGGAVVRRAWDDPALTLVDRVVGDAVRTGATVVPVDGSTRAGAPELAAVLRY